LPPRIRKQRVILRFRRREQLKRHVRIALLRSVALALAAGFGMGLVSGHDSYALRFLRRHTPEVTVSLSQALVGLPVLSELPRNRLWLWLPGSAFWLERRLTRKYSAVRAVRFDRELEANRVVVHVEPRIPLVTWNGEGFDRNGVLFSITPGTWKAMPQASFAPGASKPELGRWVARLAAMTPLWSQVTSVRQDAYGTLELTMKTGTVVVWGLPESGTLSRKAQILERILDDAHHHLGGARLADLRFFDQGRIIVRPKGAAIER
jgi:cell division protein FtsQ